ncbi:MAG: amidohydrolase family protein [Clostridia bacterium]|nr:amidohydrolase family protein [Clostridia bacterium]
MINGKIYTENSAMPWAEALVMEGKKLVYVGDNRGAEALSDNDSEIVDLEGKMIIPALIDGHTHPTTVAKTFWRVRAPFTYDKDELMDNIRKMAEKHPKEETPFFFFENYFAETFGEKGPNRKDLDEIISDRPARIQEFVEHSCWYNTVALDMLRDEDGVPRISGPMGEPVFVKDENGEYTGLCLQPGPDSDEKIFKAVNWEPPIVVDEKMLKPLIDFFHHYGVTGMMDGFTEGDENMKAFYDLDKAGKLGMYYEATSILESVDKLDEAIERAHRWSEMYTSEHVRCRVVKYFMDGTNETGDSLLIGPFSNDPTGTYHGKANATAEELRDVIVRLNSEKLDFHIHVIGDGSFRRVCDAVEEAQKICGDDWCIKVTLAHCEIIDPEDMPRVAELGMYIDWSTHWTGGYFGTQAQTYLGKERWARMYDFTKVLETGGQVGFSSDVFSYQEVVRANPYFGMHNAMTRIDADPMFVLDSEIYPGSVRPPESARLSLETLIHGYTMVNAERMRLDDIAGSIEAGKMANLIVFGNDIFSIPPEDFHKVQPLYTYFEGEKRNVPTDLKVER